MRRGGARRRVWLRLLRKRRGDEVPNMGRCSCGLSVRYLVLEEYLGGEGISEAFVLVA